MSFLEWFAIGGYLGIIVITVMVALVMIRDRGFHRVNYRGGADSQTRVIVMILVIAEAISL